MLYYPTRISFLIIATVSVAYGAELLKVARSAVALDSVRVEGQTEEIVALALKKPTTTNSPSVALPTESPKVEANVPFVNGELKAATITTTTKKPSITFSSTKPPQSATPTSQTTKPTAPAPTTKKLRRTTTTRPPRPAVSASAPVDCNSDIEFWPHGDCDKFIWCIDGEETVHTCNKGLYWDYNLEKCDWPKNVPKDHCQIPAMDVSTTTTTTTTTPVPPRDCSDDVEFHAHPDCDKFIKCVDGEPQTFHCPEGLYWDDENEFCQWPKKVSKANCKAPAKKGL